jgi:hypothetical protein
MIYHAKGQRPLVHITFDWNIAMILPCVLSVGFDPILMRSRSLVLRQAGFAVDEAYNLAGALALAKSGAVDLVLLCHTVSPNEQRRFISAVRKIRRLLPILCLNCQDCALPLPGCVVVDNDPLELVKTVKLAVQSPQASQLS